MPIDLNSRTATWVPDIRFAPAAAATASIYVFRTHSARSTVECLVTALRDVMGLDEAATLCLDGNDEALLPDKDTQGQLVFLHDAATIGGRAEFPVSIFAVFGERSEKDVRWFWTVFNPVSILQSLEEEDLIDEAEVHVISPSQSPQSQHLGGPASKWATLSTFLATSFHQAFTPPPHPDFITASLIIDHCPPILASDSVAACRIIEASDYLNFGAASGRDLSDDRYLLELEPAERMLASIVDMSCARYLLFKRRYFKQLARDCVVESEKIRRGEREREAKEEVDVKIKKEVAEPQTSMLDEVTTTESLDVRETTQGTPAAESVADTAQATSPGAANGPPPDPSGIATSRVAQRGRGRGRGRARASRARGASRGRGATRTARQSHVVVLPISSPVNTTPKARGTTPPPPAVGSPVPSPFATPTPAPTHSHHVPTPLPTTPAPVQEATQGTPRSTARSKPKRDDSGHTWAASRARAARTAARNKGLRVRTENAHVRGIQTLLDCNFARAKRLYVGYKLLGFLDEERILKKALGEDEDDEEAEGKGDTDAAEGVVQKVDEEIG